MVCAQIVAPVLRDKCVGGCVDMRYRKDGRSARLNSAAHAKIFAGGR